MKRNATDPARVVVLLRVSTEEQSLGPQAQRDACARWCAANGATVVAEYADLGVSGAAPLDERPGLLAALDALKTHSAGVLLVAKRDRLARDVTLAAMIERLAERNGARVLAADGAGNGTGPEAALMRGLMDLLAAYERAIIRSRTRAALAVKKSRNEKTGGHAPYGTRLGPDGVHLIPDPAEAAMVARARELRASGLTLRGVASALVEDGYKPRSGKAFHAETVRSMVAKVSV